MANSTVPLAVLDVGGDAFAPKSHAHAFTFPKVVDEALEYVTVNGAQPLALLTAKLAVTPETEMEGEKVNEDEHPCASLTDKSTGVYTPGLGSVRVGVAPVPVILPAAPVTVH